MLIAIFWFIISFSNVVGKKLYEIIENGIFSFLAPEINKYLNCSDSKTCSDEICNNFKKTLYLTLFFIFIFGVSVISIINVVKLFISPKKSKLVVPLSTVAVNCYSSNDLKYICFVQERIKILIRKWRKERADIFQEWNSNNKKRNKITYTIYFLIISIMIFECHLILLYGSQYSSTDTYNYIIESIQYIFVNCFVTHVLLL